MDATRQTGLTLQDLFDFPEDGMRRELIGGRLFVSPHPRIQHQKVVARITHLIAKWIDEHGGDVFPGANVDPAVGDHVEPDVVALAPGFAGAVDELSVLSAPDLLVEVSSPSTKSYDLREKRPLYERHGVPEFWFVDLDTHEVLVHRLTTGAYGSPEVYRRGQQFDCAVLPGLVVAVDDLLR